MFCLRSWASLLVFLSNASPIYVLLFLSANYFLQRPCVYCSLLLGVLVFSLFDFEADWFEPRWIGTSASLAEAATSLLGGNATVTEAVLETASIAVSALNGTGGSLASAAMDSVKRRITGDSAASISMAAANGSSGFEWLRSVVEKRGIRIPCVDVMVRL